MRERGCQIPGGTGPIVKGFLRLGLREQTGGMQAVLLIVFWVGELSAPLRQEGAALNAQAQGGGVVRIGTRHVAVGDQSAQQQGAQCQHQ
ncbi:hypothetical protein QWA_06790 [Alcaligenes faecalis subsp. faecalis NCIB 8687]|nr:hypothetical protein QWA_06790 [Alcaligenes faecalis subsp. faecalis NCIB 8687]